MGADGNIQLVKDLYDAMTRDATADGTLQRLPVEVDRPAGLRQLDACNPGRQTTVTYVAGRSLRL